MITFASHNNLPGTSNTFMSQPVELPLAKLSAHPDNPRLIPREDVMAAIVAGLTNGFDAAHALIVRQHEDGWQILSGHHRKLAAEQAGLRKVPCWV